MRVAPSANDHPRHLDAITQNRNANPNPNHNHNSNANLDPNLNPDAQISHHGGTSLPFT